LADRYPYRGCPKGWVKGFIGDAPPLVLSICRQRCLLAPMVE
jgi:hypothetical protein